MPDPFTGPLISQVSLFACNFVPYGWMPCDGRLLSVKDNQALFTLIGVSYGGDGKTYFALPDLRSAAPIHDLTRLGQKVPSSRDDAPAITLTKEQLPVHTHTGTFTGSSSTGSASVAMTVKDVGGTADPQTGDFLGKGGTGSGAATIYVRRTTTAPQVTLSPMTGTATLTPTGKVDVTPAGQGLAVTLPHIRMVWAICIIGAFPSRW